MESKYKGILQDKEIINKYKNVENFLSVSKYDKKNDLIKNNKKEESIEILTPLL